MGLQDRGAEADWYFAMSSPASVLQLGIRHPVGGTGDSDSLHPLLLRLFLNLIIILLVHLHPSYKIIGLIFTFS